MSGFDIVKAITDNVQAALEREGIKFSRKAYGDGKNIPASLIPFGQISYTGEDFEYTHGERPGYAEARFSITVVIRERDHVEAMRSHQDWAHKVRDALTVNAVNSGAIATSKPVSRVVTDGVIAEAGENCSFLKCRVTVRYRN
ncbi:MAG: hypothetical protein HY890_05630 [Deltaproteobacteria bacterium]|nr:hypothetical protein [Deltaproteobacteria bacterium]